MSSSEHSSTPEDGVKEIEELRKNIADALAEEKDLLLQIDKVKRDSNTEEFRRLYSQNTTQMHQKAVARAAEQVQFQSETSTTSEFIAHVNKNIFDLDTLLSGVEYTVRFEGDSPTGSKYFLNIEASQVTFYVQFIWHEESKTVLDTRIEIASPFQKAELVSLVNMIARKNDIPKLSRLVADYSELFTAREEILNSLEQTCAPKFKYFKDPGTPTCPETGYKFEIFDNLSRKHYLEANWSIKNNRGNDLVQHSFKFKITEEAESLGNEQKNVFKMLTETVHTDSRKVLKLIKELVRGFEEWQGTTD